MAAATTCQGPPNGALPDIKGVDTIPKDINVGMIGGSNVSNPAMVRCCAPNKVQLLDGCYLWCKMPGGNMATNTNQTVPKLTNVHDIFDNFSECLVLNGLNRSENSAFGGNVPNMGVRVSSELSTVGLGIWALVMFGVLMQ